MPYNNVQQITSLSSTIWNMYCRIFFQSIVQFFHFHVRTTATVTDFVLTTVIIRCRWPHIQQRYWSQKYLWPAISRSTNAAWQVICIFVGWACLLLVANLLDGWVTVELMKNKCSATVLLSTGLSYSPKDYGKRRFLMVLPKGTKKPAGSEIWIGCSPKRAGVHVNKFLQKLGP